MPNKYQTTWILIADGNRARIVKNDGPGLGIDAVDDQLYEREHHKTSDIMADRPGRSFDSAGSGRHAMEYSTDPERVEQREFARTLVEALEAAHRKDAFRQLVIVAPPQMLGDLRAELTDGLKTLVHAEVNKDLTHVPNGDLAVHLDGVLTL
ncbi:MAG TPA: host attachment protein [Afifellaceae bacterium]|nr:host attachment protein [Afifellaceae bacterium]